MPEPASARWRAVSAPVVILRTRPVIATLTISVVALVTPSPGGIWAGAALLLVCALTYSCGAHASLGRGGFAVGTLVVAMQLNAGFSEFPNVEIAFPTLIPFWVGYQVRLRSSLVRRLAARTRELNDEQVAFAELSVRRERARIARELHDIVAHHLAVVVVQAGAGRIATLGPSQRAGERFDAIRQSCVQAMAEMSRLVDILEAEIAGEREPGATGRWRRLIDQARAGGVALTLSAVPVDAKLPDRVEEDAYSIVREGLTNAIKHASGAHVTVRLALHEAELEIEVTDDGPRTTGSLRGTGGGLGLIGMRERAEASGGTLKARPTPDGGWRLRATLPLSRVGDPRAVPTASRTPRG
jgi:signal transduction histidine kinase